MVCLQNHAVDYSFAAVGPFDDLKSVKKKRTLRSATRPERIGEPGVARRA
jgi:hypothetical protein